MFMLTALDAASDGVIDLTAMSPEQRDMVHGQSVARRHGRNIVCRHCKQPAHLAHLKRSDAWFWKHNPGAASRCLLADVYPNGQSEEHFAAKLAIVKTLRLMTGWNAEPERRFGQDDEAVIPDVYAWHDQPSPHQRPIAWEVQLAPQTHGEFIDRTERTRRIGGVRTAWVTPYDDDLDQQMGIVTDSTGSIVTGRIYDAPDEERQMDPMPLGEFVRRWAATLPDLVWADAGFRNRWIAFPAAAATTTPRSAIQRLHPFASNSPAVDLEACRRPSAQERLTALCVGPPRPGGSSGDTCGLTTDGGPYCWVHR
jgi:hypothetical protein